MNSSHGSNCSSSQMVDFEGDASFLLVGGSEDGVVQCTGMAMYIPHGRLLTRHLQKAIIGVNFVNTHVRRRTIGTLPLVF